MASIWLARRRCSASGSHPSASSPSRSRQVRSDGSAVSPASAPASAADRCLVCSMVSAPRVNDIWVQTRMPRSSTGAPVPAPAADAPVPAVSRPRAPIRSVNACTSIAPAYRQATVPVSILLATCQLAPSPSPRAPAGSSPLSPVPPPPPAGWPSLLPASCPPSPPAVPGCCPGAVSSPSPAAGPVPGSSVSPNRVPGAGSVPCCLISSEIRDRDTPSLAPISAWVRPCPAHWRACRSRAGLRIGGAAHLVDQALCAVRAVARPDPRHLGRLDAERGGDGPALEAAALGDRADDQVPHLQVAGAERRHQHRPGVHRDDAAVIGAGDPQRPRLRHAGELLVVHAGNLISRRSLSAYFSA